MGREQMFALGRLFGFPNGPREEAPAEQPQPAPVDRHGFDQVSKQARKDPRLSHRSYRVLATLEGYCFGDDRESWAKNKTIGEGAGGISANAVRLALRELESLGYITIVPDDKKMRGSRIRILFLLKRPTPEDREEM